MLRTLSLLVALSIPLITATGCESEQCTKMRQCCAAISGEEWVGDSCGAMIENIHDPQRCSAITSAITAAGQGDKELPAVCLP